MMAETDNSSLNICGTCADSATGMEHQLHDVIARLGHLERSVADPSVELAEINAKLDRLDARVTRIEKRLDLVEG